MSKHCDSRMKSVLIKALFGEFILVSGPVGQGSLGDETFRQAVPGISDIDNAAVRVNARSGQAAPQQDHNTAWQVQFANTRLHAL